MKRKLLNELNGYITKEKLEEIKKKYLKKYKALNIFFKFINLPFLHFVNNLENLVDFRNQIFVEKEKEKYKNLFDNINGYSLDENQRDVIVRDCKNMLIVAGAGSGKSLTIVGKVMYLIAKGVHPNKILCVSFTNESSKSLKQTFFKNNLNIEVVTFHKLSMNILNDNGKKVLISSPLEEVIDECFSKFSFLFHFNTIDSDSNEIKTSFYMKKELIKNSNIFFEYKEIIISFINLFKCMGYTSFKPIYKKIKKNEKRNLIIIRLCEEIYLEYEKKLKLLCKMDFNDLIMNACNSLYFKKYDYIFVDEFQDTSKIRSILLKKIQKKTGAKIVAVGDDWQSIYSFSGSSLDSFINFKKYFKNSEVFYLKNTYRNSKELLLIAGKFIMKNPYQLKKNLNSFKLNSKPIKLFYYKNGLKDISILLKKINSKDILILTRNNKEVLKIKKIIKNKYKVMTIHSSKGLESQQVVFVDCLNFPNKREKDDIFKYILNKEENYLYAEERRLFYVALTRTKNNIYFFLSKDNESLFVKEIIKENKKYTEII